ncbi:beta strand repeat-containing protein, partial [Selenomonas ruminantium]
MSFANTLPSSGTMTLLSSTANNFSSGISVTGTAGTKSINSTTATYVQKGTNTTNAANGVTLTYEEKAGYAALNSDKSGVTYTFGNAPVSKVTLGAMTWGTGRSGSGYTYNGNSSGKTDIDATNLTFSDTATVNPLSQPMTLLSDATSITGGTITQPGTGNGTVTAVFTDDTITYNGTTAKGTVSVGTGDNAGKVLYTINSGTLSGINLNGWDGTTSAIPTGWTGTNVAVATGDTFAYTPTTNVDIFTTTTPNFFGEVTGTHRYTNQGEAFSNEDKGVTISGNKAGGVKVTNNGSIANAKLTYYAEAFDGHTITLGSMAWGTPREAGSAYNFGNLTAIDATNLSFTNPMAVGTVGTSTALLTNATDLPASFSNITYASGASSHTQDFTGAAADNGVKFNGTINGTVSTTLGQVNYTVSGKSITGIDLAGWDSTKAAYSLTGWTNDLTAGSINASGFTAPTTLTAGNSQNIITTSTPNYFSDAYITGAQKYGPSTESSSDTDKGVTFTGSQQKGVKASDNGQNLVYAVGDMTVSDITLGNMEVGTPRTATGNYTFNGSTTIDATNLKFDNPADVADATDSTLVTGATGITSSNTVTGASHSQAFTNAAMGGGIKVSGTLNGTVSAVADGVNYTVDNKTISSMDLSGWDTTTENTTLPDAKWTGSNVAVSTGTFTAPTTDKTIFTTNIGEFFGDVTGAMAYTSGAAFSETGTEGVTLSGTKSGGVKKSDDGSDLEFIAEAKTVNNITLGNMTWGTGRAMPASGYTFSVAANGVDATNLKFSFTGTDANTIANGDDWNLLTNANGLAADLVVKGTPVSQNISYSLANGATLGGTLTGKVKTYANTVNYAVTGKTLDSVDISGWDGSTTGAVNDTWSKAASGIAVTGSGFTAPTAVGDYNILTATPTGYFTGAQIADSIAYKTGSTFSETASNITLSGTQDRGVKVNTDGTALQYSIGNANINNIKIGNVTYTKDGTLINKSAALYDYSQLNSNGLDISSFGLSMTDEQKKSAATNDSMTLVQANTTLNDIAAKATGKSTYTYDATSGLAVKGAVTGAVAATNNNVVYTVTGNTASTLTFGTVAWNTGTYARQASEIAYTGALVNADNITFTGTDTLNVGDTMVLVSNYGNSVNKISSGIFTLNGQTGKGHAYWNGGNLYYVIDRAAGTSVPTVNAIGNKEIVDSNPDYNNPAGVPGGQAQGGGESKDNETIINNSHIHKNTDGTGGDANGGTSEDGDADKNHLTVNNSTVDGDANGGTSDTGNTEENEVIIKRGTIHGGVAGGETLGGHGGSRRNKTTVEEESTVEGDVDGGKTGGDGETEENEVVITGSKIGGDVNGGHSGGSGGSKGNETTLDGTEVGGDVNGGKTDGNGETKGNEANVKNGSKVTGTVTGGRSGGNGDCTGNAAEVEGS